MGRAAKGGSHVPHLQRRHGTYYLRVRVPDALRMRIGLREVRRSLGVHTFSKARLLAPRLAAQLMEVFVLAQARELSRDEVLALVDRRFAVLAEEVDRTYRPNTADPYLERAYDEQLLAESTAGLRRQIATQQFEQPVLHEVARALADAGLTADAIGPDTMDRLTDGIARALIEQDRLSLFRMSDGLLSYEPSDPLFSRRQSHVKAVEPTSALAPLGPTVSEALQIYLAEGQALWSRKTVKSRGRQLSYLVEHLGPDRHLSTVTATDIVSYRDALRRLRPRHKRDVGQTFRAKQTENEDARITAGPDRGGPGDRNSTPRCRVHCRGGRPARAGSGRA